MEIKRAGSQPSRKGPTDYFTGTVRIDRPVQPPDPARVRGASVTFEPRGPHRIAHASPRPDINSDSRLRLGPARGRPRRRNPPWRCRLVPTRREALVRRHGNHRHDPHRHPGSVARQGRRLDGAGDRRTIPRNHRPDNAATEAAPVPPRRQPARQTTWTSDELDKIGGAEELQITSLRRDGTLRGPVTIWVVRLGNDLYSRSRLRAHRRLVSWHAGSPRRPHRRRRHRERRRLYRPRSLGPRPD